MSFYKKMMIFEWMFHPEELALLNKNKVQLIKPGKFKLFVAGSFVDIRSNGVFIIN